MNRKPVYLTSTRLNDSDFVLLGHIDENRSEHFYNWCERTFDWMCGYDDSGFDEPIIKIFLDGFDPTDLMTPAWIACMVREHLIRHHEGQREARQVPPYHYHSW